MSKSIGSIEFNNGKHAASYEVFQHGVGLYTILYHGDSINISLAACRDNGWTLKTDNKALRQDWERGGPKPLAKGVSTKRVSPQKRWENIHGKAPVKQTSFS